MSASSVLLLRQPWRLSTQMLKFVTEVVDILLLSMGSDENKLTTMDIQTIKVIWQIIN